MAGGKIFINYRREASLTEAQLLQSELSHCFGKSRIFLDIEGLEGGQNWLQTIERRVGASAAMVVLICKDWADLKDTDGNRRLDNPNDVVRYEIALALARKVPVLPVLIDGASMPSATQLPPNIAPLTFTQAMLLRRESFSEDATKIAQQLNHTIARKGPRRMSWPLAGSIAAVALLAGGAGGWWLQARDSLRSIEIATAQRGENEARQRGAESKLDAARKDNAALAGQIAEKNTTIATLNAAVESAKAKFDESTRQLDDLKRQLASVVRIREEAQRRLEEALQKLPENGRLLEKLTRDIAARDGEIAAKDREIAELKAQLSSAKAKTGEAERTVSEATRLRDEAQSKFEKEQAARKEAQRESALQADETARLKASEDDTRRKFEDQSKILNLERAAWKTADDRLRMLDYEAFTRAQEERTVAAYERYLRDWSRQGEYLGKAQKEKDELTRILGKCDNLAANPFNPETKNGGVMWDDLIKKLPDAIEACEQATERSPNTLRAQYQLARAYHRAVRLEEAETILKKLVVKRYLAAYDNLGWIVFDRSYKNRDNPKYAEETFYAIYLFSEAATAEQPLAEAMSSLGDVYLCLDKREQAISWFRLASDGPYGGYWPARDYPNNRKCKYNKKGDRDNEPFGGNKPFFVDFLRLRLPGR